MVTEAKTTNYWISNSALYIQLNATGEPNRIQASVVSGASILCYMQGIDGLGYDAGHNYQRWTLAAYPSEFPSDEKRYVYVAIPRKRTSDNDIATIVFPSQKIDIYGKAIVLKTDEDGKQEEVVGDQIGSEDYYYIYLQGIISEVYLNEANDRIRRWVQDVDFGSLSTDEALASGGVTQWWKYNSVSDTITFLKTILSATFESLVAKTISVTTLFFGKEKKITGIASDESKEDSEEVIVTPKYLKKYGGGKYLSKVKDDTAEGLINFAKGLIAKGLADLKMGAKFGNNAMITQLGKAFFRAIKSLDYDNAAEQGFSVEKEKNGKYHAFFTNLTIWGKARFHELEVRKLSYSGGNIYLSGAGSKLIKVVPVKQSVSGGVTSWVKTTENDVKCVGWKCYLLADNGTTATMNDWQEGDQARCQTMGEIVSGGTYQNASNKSYWRTIPKGGVSTQNEKIYGSKLETYLDEDGNEQTREVQVELYDGQAFAWIVIGKHCGDIDGYDDEFSVGYNGSNPAPLETRGIPAEGDTIVLDGNRHRNDQQEYDKTDRQNVIVLETTGEYAPRIACYANISEYKHTFTKSVNGSDKEVSLSVFETSPKGGTKINSSRFEWISDDGSTINIINYRGDWEENNTYHKNDQVNHNNAVWVCVANSGVDVSEEPLDGATYWKKVLSGGKGEKGDKGDDGLSGNGIVPVYTRSEGTPTPPTSTDKNNLDNGWSLTIPSVADVKNVSYSDSSWTDYNDGSYTWKKSPTTANNSTSWCLVTFTTTQANQAVKFVIKSFSEPRYDYIFLSEIDASVVPPKPDYKGASRAVSGNGVELSITDVVATAGTHTVYICYGKDASGDYNGDYGLFRIESMAGIPLWQSNGKEVFTRDGSGVIKSEIESWSEPFRVTGEDGTDGKDAVSYTVTLTRGSNGVTQGLYVGVTRYIGTACTTGTIISFGMSCKAYTDGTLAEGLTDRLQTSDNYIDFAAFPKAKSFTVELFDKNGNKVATGNYSSGDDAISILVEDAPLVFDTDDSGTVPADDTKTAKVKVMRGNANVTNDCNQELSRNDLSSNCMCDVKKDKDNECISVSVQGRWIVKNDVIVDGVNQGKVSATSGYAVAQFVYDSVVYFAQVPFSVNVAKFTGSVAFDNKRYKAQFDELSKGGGAATKNELTQATSKFEQTARKISLSVSEKSIARRNLLVGSAFLREDNNWSLSSDTRIEMNTGYQGTNCIRISDDTTDGKTRYPGAFWDGSQGGKSVRITKGKKYVISCWYYTNDTNGHLSLEALYTDKQTNAERKGAPKYLSAGSLVPKPNQWQLFTTVIDTTDAEYDYIAFNFYEYCSVESGLIEAYICRPMVEEGDTYGGWTLSQNDYDIIGANLIDNSRTLDAGGNVLTVIGEKTLIGDVYELTASGSDDYNQFYRINGNAFKLNTDYTISFEVRGNAKYIQVNAFYPANNTKYTCYTEPQNGVMSEKAGDGTTVGYVTLGEFEVLQKQQRVWAHFRFKDRLPEQLYLQFTKNTEQTGVTSWNVTITRPKIEVGAVVTEYTERKSDLVDKASLKAAGIEITSDQVILYGNKVQVKNPKENPSEGYDEAAMFQNGKLNAQFINAGDIVAEGINAKKITATKLNVTGDSKIGIWHITKVDGWGDIMQAEGTEYNGATVVSGIQYCPLFVRGGSLYTAYFRVGVSCTEFSYQSTLNCFNAVWFGDAARIVCKGSVNDVNLPTNYDYNTQYEPVQYIYSEQSKQESPALAINVIAKGFSGTPTAIQTNGAIRGVFAPNSKSISSYNDKTIPNDIGVVICTNDSDMTLTLPANPLEGQTLIIIQGSGKRVYIVPYGDEKIWCRGQTRDKNTKFYSGTIGQFNIFVYVRGAWQLQFMNSNV